MEPVAMDLGTFRAVLEELTARGMDLTVRDEQGSTILHSAAWNGHLELVEELVEDYYVEVDAMLRLMRGTYMVGRRGTWRRRRGMRRSSSIWIRSR